MQVLSDIVQRAGLRDGQQIAMDFQIGAYVDDAGACDRIQKTCIPQSYTRHTSREDRSQPLPAQLLLRTTFHYPLNPSSMQLPSLGNNALVTSHSQAQAQGLSKFILQHGVCHGPLVVLQKRADLDMPAGFLIVFLTFLPFSLWEVTGWASPVVEAVIAFLFMGIDNIGMPFSKPCPLMLRRPPYSTFFTLLLSGVLPNWRSLAVTLRHVFLAAHTKYILPPRCDICLHG